MPSAAAKLQQLDPLVLGRLVVYLADKGDPDQALTLYEKAVAAGGQSKPSAADVLLRMEIGQLYFMAEKPKPAAECFAAVLHALDHPGESGLDDGLKKVLLGEPGPTYQMMGECFLAAGRPEEAQAAFQKAEQAAPDKAVRQFNLARLDAKTGKPAEALKALEAAFAGHLADQGMAPYETLAEVLGEARQEGRVDRPAGKTPRRQSEGPAAGLLPGPAVPRGRQTGQGRAALSRIAQGHAHADRLPRAGGHLSPRQAV